jgi:hypothetical protein
VDSTPPKAALAGDLEIQFMDKTIEIFAHVPLSDFLEWEKYGFEV